MEMLLETIRELSSSETKKHLLKSSVDNVLHDVHSWYQLNASEHVTTHKSYGILQFNRHHAEYLRLLAHQGITQCDCLHCLSEKTRKIWTAALTSR
ncbi:hypothetical protein JTB14_012920 [Gonioctena quinquepunctata]|nr:hypothetical protein JTB14_012920 [Gonioctena quinquepunctata]